MLDKLPVEETDDVPAEMTTDGGSTGADHDLLMDDEQIASFLERQGWGCLTLAKDDSAYSIPMSFAYDGDSTLYFQLQTDADGEKMSYLDATTTATFLVPEVQPPDWTSVIVRGPVVRISDDELEAAYTAFADNAWFPACPWMADKDPSETTFYKLESEEISGRTSVFPK